MQQKIKLWLKKYWKLLVSILFFMAVSGIVLLIFNLTGANNPAQLKAVFDGVGFWKYPLFIFLQVLLGVLMSFSPISSNMVFIIVGCMIFGWWQNFILCTISIISISFILYFLGRKFGRKLGNKLVGADTMKSAENFLQLKGRVYLPVMFLFPIFPDDALCIVAGATKMKFLFFAISVISCRSVGILTWCLSWLLFGELIDIFDIFNAIIVSLGDVAGWVMIITIILVMLMAIYHAVRIVRWLANKVDKAFGAQEQPLEDKE